MRVKKGVGVSFDEATLNTIDRLLSRCQHQRSREGDKNLICIFDGAICDYERCQREEKKKGFFYKHFESRSKFIEYCIEFVASIAESDEEALENTIGFIRSLSEDPRLGEKLCFFLKELKSMK